MADATSIYTDPTNMDKDNVQLSIWNGTKWVELSNGLTINTINSNVSEIADKVAEAQQGIAQATTDAQNAVDSANEAITQAGFANDTATTAKQVADTANSVATQAQSDISTVSSDLTTAKTNLQSQIDTTNQNVTDVSSALDTTKTSLQTVSDLATQNGKDINTTNSTVSGIQTDLANTQGDVTELQTTATGLRTDVTNAQGDISSLKVTATGVESDVSSLQSDNSTNKSNISSLQNTANGLTSTVASVQTQVNNSAVGTNLLMGTSSDLQTAQDSQSNTTGGFIYNFSSDEISTIAGNKVTARAFIHNTTTHTVNLVMWTNEGGVNVGTDVPAGTDGYSTIIAYNIPSSSTMGNITIRAYTDNVAISGVQYNKLKLEKGSVATDWCLNPSELTTITALSSVKQEADSISTTVTSNKTSSDNQFSTINQTISGIQSTVSNKADSSIVTQLSSVVDSKVNTSDYQSEITQLSSDINLRVKSADLLSQINIESGNVLIQSNKIYLDASSVVFGGDAFIPSANIASISADKISTGTMTAGAINLGNGTFKVDTSGNLTANNANLTGTLSSGSSSSYNYEVSTDGVVFRDGTNTFATLEGFALGNYNYAGLASDNTVIGRTVKSDVVTGKVAYVSSSTSDGILLNRVNAFNDNATTSLQVGNNLGSGMDYLDALLFDSTSKSGAEISMYGYDSQNKKDTQAVYIKASNSSNSVSEISVDPTEVMLQSPNSTLTLDNDITKAVTLTTSEANGIQFSTSVGFITMDSKTELDLTAKTNINISSTSGNLTLQSNGKFNINAVDGTAILAFDTNASSGWIYANNLLWAKTALRTSYLWVEGKADISGVVNCQSVNQTSLLSKKTNITKLNIQDVINAVNTTEFYEYAYRRDLELGINKRYTSLIIDDVNEVAQYNEPSEFLSDDRQGRDDGTLLAYVTMMVQEMYKEIQKLKNK